MNGGKYRALIQIRKTLYVLPFFIDFLQVSWSMTKLIPMPPSYWYQLVFTLFSIIFSGVLVNLHHSQASNGNTGECGLINIDAIQQVVAAKWAVDVINNQSLPHELRIGRSTSNSKSIFSHVLPRYCQTRPLDFCTQCVIWTRIIFLEKCDSF